MNFIGQLCCWQWGWSCQVMSEGVQSVAAGFFLWMPFTQLNQQNIGPFLWLTVQCPVASNYSWNGAFIIFMSVCSDDIHMPVTSLLNSLTSPWGFSLLILCRTFTPHSFWTEDHDEINISTTNDIQVCTYSLINNSNERCRQRSAHFVTYCYYCYFHHHYYHYYYHHHHHYYYYYYYYYYYM